MRTSAPRSVAQPPPAAAPVPGPPPTPPVGQVKPLKFTALIDAETDARFGRLLDQLRTAVGPIATRPDGSGRSRAGYRLSRADLLRALLAAAEDDPSVMTEVAAKARHHYVTP